MLRTTTMFEPAHDGFVFTQHLHAIDAKIKHIAFVAAIFAGRRSLGHDQRPCNQRGRFARPARLNRDFGQVNIIARHDDFLTRGLGNRFGFHRHHGFRQRQHRKGFFEAAGRFGLFEEGQRFADFAQFFGLSVHALCHAVHRAKQIDQNRHVIFFAVIPDNIFKQHRRAAFGQKARLDFCHFKVGGNRFSDTNKTAGFFQRIHEVTKGLIGHGTCHLLSTKI